MVSMRYTLVRQYIDDYNFLTGKRTVYDYYCVMYGFPLFHFGQFPVLSTDNMKTIIKYCRLHGYKYTTEY